MSVATTETSAGTRPAFSLRGTRVLIVEDSWIVAQSLKAILELIGAAVMGPAVSLDDAIALADSERFDVAIMDRDLQGRMTDVLIANLHERGLPVVIVTAYDVEPELAAKAAAVLPKPVKAENLLACVRQVRAQSQTRH